MEISVCGNLTIKLKKFESGLFGVSFLNKRFAHILTLSQPLIKMTNTQRGRNVSTEVDVCQGVNTKITRCTTHSVQNFIFPSKVEKKSSVNSLNVENMGIEHFYISRLDNLYRFPMFQLFRRLQHPTLVLLLDFLHRTRIHIVHMFTLPNNKAL